MSHTKRGKSSAKHSDFSQTCENISYVITTAVALETHVTARRARDGWTRRACGDTSLTNQRIACRRPPIPADAPMAFFRVSKVISSASWDCKENKRETGLVKLRTAMAALKRCPDTTDFRSLRHEQDSLSDRGDEQDPKSVRYWFSGTSS